jgi:hypothetical protein
MVSRIATFALNLHFFIASPKNLHKNGTKITPIARSQAIVLGKKY